MRGREIRRGVTPSKKFRKFRTKDRELIERIKLETLVLKGVLKMFDQMIEENTFDMRKYQR
jgi:hypothetical protein